MGVPLPHATQRAWWPGGRVGTRRAGGRCGHLFTARRWLPVQLRVCLEGRGVWKDYYSVTMSLQKEKLFKSKNELLNFVMKRPDFTV